MHGLKRKMLGAACVLLSIPAPYWIYAVMHDVDTSQTPPHYGFTAAAAAISATLFCAFRLAQATRARAGCWGTLASYLAFLLAALGLAAMADPRQNMMFWPLAIPVGAVYLAPLVFLNYIGSGLIVGRK